MKYLPEKIKEIIGLNFTNWYSIESYSQSGEDIVLRRIFDTKNKGFYVDVGAHHPMKYSNTYYFYKKGWRGINIDALPGSMRLFKKIRPKDINLEIAISDKNETLTFYLYNDPAVNSFSKKLALKRAKEGSFNVISTIEIKTKTLSEVLESFLPKGQKIDFLSIDTEGLDLNVLKSNNWNKFIPSVILIEDLGLNSEYWENNEIKTFLIDKGYEMHSKIVDTLIFRKL